MAVHDVRLSKTLSWLLRHQAAKEGLDIQTDGFVPCDQVVGFLSKRHIPGMTRQRLFDEVRACPKQRLELSPCGLYVRASHGHSIRALEDEKFLVEIADASTVVNPTYGISSQQWQVVRTAGLRCGTRNHLHIATCNSNSGYTIGKPGGKADVLVHLDLGRAMADGMKFFLASNGVVLTRGLHGVVLPTYFARVVIHNGDGSTAELFAPTHLDRQA